MSQKNKARHCQKCQLTVQTTNGSKTVVPSKKRKEEAKQTLYLKRI